MILFMVVHPYQLFIVFRIMEGPEDFPSGVRGGKNPGQFTCLSPKCKFKSQQASLFLTTADTLVDTDVEISDAEIFCRRGGDSNFKLTLSCSHFRSITISVHILLSQMFVQVNGIEDINADTEADHVEQIGLH